jgi:hypothetical protein
MWSAYNDRPEISRQLLAAGADLNLENADGETALIKAGQRGFVREVEFFRHAGATKTNVFLNRSPYPAPPLPQARAWCLAATALLVQYNGDSHELLGSIPPTQRDRAQQNLLGWWQIGNRQAAIRKLDWLRDEGHRARFASRNSEVALRVAQPFLAWDYCRLIWVAGQSYVAGYLTEDEAWARILPAARAIQGNYPSWREMGRDYLRGRGDWAKQRDPRFESIFELLCNPADTNSPWNKNPWSLNLEAAARPEVPQ